MRLRTAVFMGGVLLVSLVVEQGFLWRMCQC